MMSECAFEIIKLTGEWENALKDFFIALRSSNSNDYFYPHPLDDISANQKANYTGQDLYYILVEKNRILGYGMLRGWDEGYSIPSLGIAILPEERGSGLAKLFMKFLHMVARRRGSERVRLKVHKNNVIAKSLYEKLGYQFIDQERDQLIGIFQF
jgi:ribosomal-protein-alanine N-acetyltransferase